MPKKSSRSCRERSATAIYLKPLATVGPEYPLLL